MSKYVNSEGIYNFSTGELTFLENILSSNIQFSYKIYAIIGRFGVNAEDAGKIIAHYVNEQEINHE